MQSSFRRFWCHVSVIFRTGFFHKLLFYSDYSSDEMILRLWEWSQDNPEEAGSVFFKLKFSCDCLLKCPCFTLWGEVDLCRLELPEHKLHNSCCLQATSKVSLETRADAPASSLTSGFISAWILCPADSGQLAQKAVKLQLSYIRLKKSILFVFYSFIISVVSLMRDLETRVQSLHFNTKSVFFSPLNMDEISRKLCVRLHDWNILFILGLERVNRRLWF